MTEDQLPLQAAGIFCDHLLLDVVEENEKMREDSSRRLQVACDFLGRIDLRLGSGHVVSTSLNKSDIIEKFFCGMPFLRVYCVDCGTLPLSDFRSGRVSMSGQDIGIAEVGSIRAIHDVGDLICVSILFSNYCLGGEVRGLSNDDLIRLRDGEDAREQLMHHRTTSNSITFTPDSIFMRITPDLRETILTFGPRPTYESSEHVGGEPLPVDPSDCIKYPPLPHSDKSRLAIVTALGCSDSQMLLLDENQHLKNEQVRLTRIEERLGSVEISHTKGKLNLSLKHGQLCAGAGGSYWYIPLQGNEDHSSYVALNDLPSLECLVSGISLQPDTMALYRIDQLGSQVVFMKTFGSGAKVSGEFDVEFSEAGFGEMMERAILGESSFPPTSKLKLTSVFLPLDSVENVLNVLGIEIVDNDDNT